MSNEVSCVLSFGNLKFEAWKIQIHLSRAVQVEYHFHDTRQSHQARTIFTPPLFVF